MRQQQAGRLCWVLDEDPDLAQGVPPAALWEVRQRAVARVIDVPVGEWNAEAALGASGPPGPGGARALLTLEGAFVRELTSGWGAGSVIVGPGDMIFPRTPEDDVLVPRTVRWTALCRAQLAVLDGDFLRRVAPWPQIPLAILQRAGRQSQTLALQQTIACQVRVEDRVLMLLLALAERWGRVVSGGIRLDLPLSVTRLAGLVAAQRQTASSTVASLARQGLVERIPGGWFVRGAARERVAAALSADAEPAVTDHRSRPLNGRG